MQKLFIIIFALIISLIYPISASAFHNPTGHADITKLTSKSYRIQNFSPAFNVSDIANFQTGNNVIIQSFHTPSPYTSPSTCNFFPSSVSADVLTQTVTVNYNYGGYFCPDQPYLYGYTALNSEYPADCDTSDISPQCRYWENSPFATPPLPLLPEVNDALAVNTITYDASPAHKNVPVTVTGTFFDQATENTHTATWNWGDGTTSTGTVAEDIGSGSVIDTHTYSNSGNYTVSLTVTDNNNISASNTATLVVAKQITALSPAQVYVSKALLNIGVKFDVKAEVYKDATLISSGELDSVAPRSTATLETIPFNSFSPVDFLEGSALKLVISVRNACSGSLLNSGTATLYYNNASVDSKFGATIGTTNSTYHMLDSFLLGTSAGSTQKTIAVAAGAKCSAFKPFGTWRITP